MVEIIDGVESIVMSLGGLKAASRGALLGIERAQVYELRTDARKNNDAVKKGIASSIDTAKEESTRKLDKALKTLTDQENGELAKSESIPYPNPPKLKRGATEREKDRHEVDMIFYKEQRQLITREKEPAQTFNKELSKRVKESLTKHPSFSAYIDKKYGSFEDVPTGKKGTIDYVSLAKDFMKSPFANVRSAPKSQSATSVLKAPSVTAGSSPKTRKDSPRSSPRESATKDARRTSRQIKNVLAVAEKRRAVRKQRLEQERNGQQALFPTSKPKSKSSYRPGDRVLY